MFTLVEPAFNVQLCFQVFQNTTETCSELYDSDASAVKYDFISNNKNKIDFITFLKEN